METLEKDKIASKPVLMNVLNEYSGIVENIAVIIKESGVKAKYIAKRLELPESTFYHKKKNKTFSFPEVKKIVELLDDEDDEALEDEYLNKIADSRMNDEICSIDELLNA
jgi:predicted transcriptional regulator